MNVKAITIVRAMLSILVCFNSLETRCHKREEVLKSIKTVDGSDIQLRLVVFLIIYKVLYIQAVGFHRISEPSQNDMKLIS